MKIELAHDSLAAKIYDKVSLEEKNLRKVEKFIEDRYAFYLSRDGLLTREEFDYIKPYLDQVDISSEQQQFIRRSKAATTRRRRILVALVAGVFLTISSMAIYSIIQRNDAISKTQLALKNENEAQKNLREAQRKERLIKVQKRETERLRSVAEQKAFDAEINLELAKRNAIKANNNAIQIKKREGETRKALDSLKLAHLKMIELFIEISDKEVLNLNFQAALEVLRESKVLVGSHKKLSRRFMEMAYFFNEIGNNNMAIGLLDTALSLYPKQKEVYSEQSYRGARNNSQKIQEELWELDSIWIKMIQGRYYPTMVEILGGKFCHGSITLDLGDCESSDGSIEYVEGFKLARTETTVWQYFLFVSANDIEMTQSPPWGWVGNNPMVNVSWYESV
ncbi:MAG: hypothetical protein AAFR61_31450, partial [Bacteroidota bacterium]